MTTRFRVDEMFLLGRMGERDGGEDRIVLSEGYAAVIDGSTAKTKDSRPHLMNGADVAEVLASEIAQLPIGMLMHSALDALNTAVQAERRVRYSQQELPVDECPSAAIAIISLDRNEIWQVGDCRAVIGGIAVADNNAPFTDRIAAQARSVHLQCLLAAGVSEGDLMETDPGREMILPLLRAAARIRNLRHPLSYGTIDGATDPTVLARKTSIPADAQHVVLTTDGYPSPKSTLSETEKELAVLLAKDPLLIDEPQTKGIKPGGLSFDDRAYLSLVRS